MMKIQLKRHIDKLKLRQFTNTLAADMSLSSFFVATMCIFAPAPCMNPLYGLLLHVKPPYSPNISLILSFFTITVSKAILLMKRIVFAIKPIQPSELKKHILSLTMYIRSQV